jgi:hypothetical protein
MQKKKKLFILVYFNYLFNLPFRYHADMPTKGLASANVEVLQVSWNTLLE